MPPASAEEVQRSAALRDRIQRVLTDLGGDSTETRRTLVADAVATIEHGLTGIEQFGIRANGRKSGTPPEELALTGLMGFLDDGRDFLTTNLDRWERILNFRDQVGNGGAAPEPDVEPEPEPEQRVAPTRRTTRRGGAKRSTAKKRGAKKRAGGKRKATARRKTAGRGRRRTHTQEVTAEMTVSTVDFAEADFITGVRLRYVDELFQRLREQRDPSPEMLSRIERIAGLGE